MNDSGRRTRRASSLAILRIIAVLIAAALAGCVQKAPVPYFARAGDTIIVGLGGIQRNMSGYSHLAPSDLLITATRVGGGTPITLPATSVFRAFPDYASLLNKDVAGGLVPAATLFVPFDGGWFTTISLPNDGTLTPGSYLLSIASPTGKLINIKYNNGFSEGDLTQLPLEIDAGTASNSSYAQQFSSYANSPTLDISPSTLAGITAVSGLQLVINYSQAHYDPAHLPMVLPYSHNPYIQLAQNVIDNGNGTGTMIVLLSTQQAFVPNAGQTPFTPLLSDLSLRIMYFLASGQTPSTAQIASDFQIDPSRSYYYDTSGAVISSMQPTLSFQLN